jgi:hypothetical protein
LVFIGISVGVITVDDTVLEAALPVISRQSGASTNELHHAPTGRSAGGGGAGQGAQPGLHRPPERPGAAPTTAWLAKSEQSVQAAHTLAASLGDPAMARELITAVDQAYIIGMAHAVEVGAVVLAGAVLVAWRSLPAQFRRREAEDAKLDGLTARG